MHRAFTNFSHSLLLLLRHLSSTELQGRMVLGQVPRIAARGTHRQQRELRRRQLLSGQAATKAGRGQNFFKDLWMTSKA